MSLHLYNTLSRSSEEFVSLTPGKAGIYLCGATVQGAPHIGHIRSGVNFDILRRWLTHLGYEVTFIRNVTDIDDKILQKAEVEGIPWWAVAMKYEQAFSWAYSRVNVLSPTYEPRATGHITQMIELMQTLIDNGTAYAPGNGDVYLNVRSLKSYLTLSNQKLMTSFQPEMQKTVLRKILEISHFGNRRSQASLRGQLLGEMDVQVGTWNVRQWHIPI